MGGLLTQDEDSAEREVVAPHSSQDDVQLHELLCWKGKVGKRQALRDKSKNKRHMKAYLRAARLHRVK